MLGLVSFLLPMGEFLIFKRHVEPLSAYMFVEMVLSTYAIYWWYTADKRERSFLAGPLQNLGVIFLTPVALPVYFVRSRGWARGAIATLWGVWVVAAVVGLTWLGQIIGWSIAF